MPYVLKHLETQQYAGQACKSEKDAKFTDDKQSAKTFAHADDVTEYARNFGPLWQAEEICDDI